MLPGSSSLFLAFCGSLTAIKLWSFIFEEGCTYFSSKVEVVCQEEILEMSYQTHKSSHILAFIVADKGDVFVSDYLWKEK